MDVGAKQSSISAEQAMRSVAPKDWFIAAALVAAVFLVYQPSWHGGFLFDDDVDLLNNPVIQPGGLAKIWVPDGNFSYRPLFFTAYWLQFHLWGLQPLGYHLVNIALHGLSALLVWRVLVRLQIPGALFAAAIFALHPVNVEAVAWIAQLNGVLSLVLALVSVLFYLSNERSPSRWRYALAIATFLLSALAKVEAATLPVVLLACAWWQRGRIEWRDLRRVLPYFLIGAVMAGVEVWAQQHFATGGVVRSDGILSRAAVAGCALWFYLGKLIWPVDLSPIYPRWAMDEHNVLSYLPGVAWIALLALAWWRLRTSGRPVWMLLVCYSALLLPVLGFVNISFMAYSLVADHWQYAATIVPFALFAATTATLAERFLLRPAGIVTAVALLAVLSVLSWRQSGTYADAETFFETTIARNPGCWPAYYNLAVALAGRGEIDAAIGHYEKALAINPDYADARINLGNALAGRGQIDLAIAHFERALKIEPNSVAAHYNLAVALARCGRENSAIAHYQSALEINPNFAEAHYNIGLLLAARGEIDSAIAHYKKALEINPDYAEVHFNFAIALTRRGEIDSAIVHYEKALEINPSYADAHSNLGNILARRGDLDSAIAHYRKALEIKPDYPAARQNLAIVLSEREKRQKEKAGR